MNGYKLTINLGSKEVPINSKKDVLETIYKIVALKNILGTLALFLKK